MRFGSTVGKQWLNCWRKFRVLILYMDVKFSGSVTKHMVCM